MPSVIEVYICDIRVLYACWISSSDEMGYTCIHTGRCMPKNLIRSTVIHRGRPDGKNSVFWVKSAIVQQGLMLPHSVIKWNIILLHPTTKRVK